MKALRKFLDKVEPHFQKRGKLERLYYLYEVIDVFFFSRKKTKSPPHVRDGMDLKRMMVTVMISLIPAVLMALYNTGFQANLALETWSGIAGGSWQRDFMSLLGIHLNPDAFFSNVVHGALYFFPVYFITFAVGIFWEIY